MCSKESGIESSRTFIAAREDGTPRSARPVKPGRRLAALLLVWSWLPAAAAVPASDGASAAALAAGDADYKSRAEGATGPGANPARIDAAIAAYRRALSLDPDAPEARFKLLRALFFRARFCGATAEERRKIFEEAKALGDDGIDRLERRIGGLKGAPRVEALRRSAGAAALCFWTAVSWGEWALARGKLAAARQGAGTRIRGLGQTVVDLDPELEQGGGYRILGRLHDQSPRIPLLTGWVSRQAALSNLRKALALGPQNSVNQFFLAEAILNHEPAQRDEARRLLTLCASSRPRDEYRVEDAYYAELSRQRLLALR
jgi:tetratricopeptide (TPR) repeat protein